MWFPQRATFSVHEDRAVAEVQRAEWIGIRAAGRARFTLRDHVLPHGLPVALALVFINTVVGGRYGDHAFVTLLAEGGYYFSGILALAYASARLEWHDRERVHHARYGQSDDASSCQREPLCARIRTAQSRIARRLRPAPAYDTPALETIRRDGLSGVSVKAYGS
jgi:hypothetical protein